MDYQAIKSELDTDSLGVGYSGMTDGQVVEALNSTSSPYGRTIVKSSLSGASVFESTDSAEFDALTDAQRSEWLSLCAIESLDPANGTPAAATATRIFGGGSTTVANLQTLRSEVVGRGTELGFGDVNVGDVQNARAL
jgi:hypothetical protein